MIGLLRIAALAALAVWLLANRRTRSIASIALVAALTIAVVLAQQFLDSPLRLVIQGAAYGIAWSIALWQPRWLRAGAETFGSLYDRIDAKARQRVRIAQAGWQSGTLAKEAVVKTFDDAIAAYGQLEPLDPRWVEVVAERTALLSRWRDLIDGRLEPRDELSSELQQREEALGGRVKGLRKEQV
jgi:hypothetical protein